MKTSPATKPVQISRLVMAVFLSPKYDAGIPTAQKSMMRNEKSPTNTRKVTIRSNHKRLASKDYC